MQIERVILTSGLRIIMAPFPYARTATVALWVDQGTKNEADEEIGVSHLIEHLVCNFSQTGHHAQLFENLMYNGGKLNAVTTKDYTYFHCTTLAEEIGHGIRLLASIPYNLPGEDYFEKEKQIIYREMEAAKNTGNNFREIFCDALWGGKGYGRPIIGTHESIEEMSHEHVQKTIKEVYNTTNCFLVVAGCFDPAEVQTVAAEAFAYWYSGQKNELQPELNVFWRNNVIKRLYKSSQALVCFGFPGVPFADTVDYYGLEILRAVMGREVYGRLYQTLRVENNLAYGTGAFNISQLYSGAFGIWAICYTEDFRETCVKLQDQLVALPMSGVGDEEVESAKKQLQIEQLNSLEVFRNNIALMGQCEMLNRKFDPDEIITTIRKITAHDINRLIQGTFKMEDISYTLIVNEEAEAVQEFIDNLGPLSARSKAVFFK